MDGIPDCSFSFVTVCNHFAVGLGAMQHSIDLVIRLAQVLFSLSLPNTITLVTSLLPIAHLVVLLETPCVTTVRSRPAAG